MEACLRRVSERLIDFLGLKAGGSHFFRFQSLALVNLRLDSIDLSLSLRKLLPRQVDIRRLCRVMLYYSYVVVTHFLHYDVNFYQV